MYCFQKKDGTVKKYYRETINYILTATVKKHIFTKYRSDEVTKTIYCYTTISQKFNSKNGESMRYKILEIISQFKCKAQFWYSGSDMSTWLLGEQEDIESMLNELRKY